MGYDPAEPISEGLYPRGFRKFLALILFFAATTTPTVFLWQNPPDSPAVSEAGSFAPYPAPPSRYPSHRPYGPQASSSSGSTWWLLFCSFMQLSLATFGGLFSLALYYPRSGFKRFALLCGPLVGLGTMFLLGIYLAARTNVYRFEIPLVAIVGAAPGLTMYVLLVSWKANRLAEQALPMQATYVGEPLYQADPISPAAQLPSPQYPKSSRRSF